MKVYNSIEDFSLNSNVVLTIGTFDGVHLGHQSIINSLNRKASLINGESVLLTFDPHPRHVLFPNDHGLKLLNTIEERVELLRNYGLNNLIIQTFTSEFSRIRPENFIRDVVYNKLSVHTLVVGYDHHFGKNREGSFKELQSLSELYGFDLEEIPAREQDAVTISSTKIRNLLKNGDINQANKFLGYNYIFSGTVIHGKKLGRTIGFPTANIKIKGDKLLPYAGVYAVRINLDQVEYYGMLNIDLNTFNPEVHIFDFSNDIYGKEIRIEIISFIREGKKMDNIDILKKQLIKDDQFCRKLFKII